MNAITKSGTNSTRGSALLRESQQGLGREERVRPDCGADPAAVRRLDRRSDSRRIDCSTSARSSSSDFENTRNGRVQPRRRHAGRRTTPRRTTTTRASRSRFDATNDAVDDARPGRLPDARVRTASACATARATTRRSTRTPRATRSPEHDQCAHATTAPRRIAPTSSSASTTSTLSSRPAARGARPVARESGRATRERHGAARDRQRRQATGR